MPNWTKEQQRVIDTRGYNIIVSAAAGSGKTAVLVERILAKITDKEHPLDIDEILVVTFTKAAAAEMRERVLKGILELLDENPGDEYLSRQATLVHNAFITTIDSFCSYVVRNYFYEIDLDPSFRVGDEATMRLLKEKVLDELMENEHEQTTAEGGVDSAFYRLLKTYGKNNSDATIAEMVMTLYEKAESFPWPEEFLDGLLAPYDVQTEEDIVESQWFMDLMAYIRQELSDAREEVRFAKQICEMENGPTLYLPNVTSDLAWYDSVLSIEEPGAFYEQFRSFDKFLKMPGNKKCECDKDLKEQARKILSDTHDYIKEKVVPKFALGNISTILAQQQAIYPHVAELIRLAKRYRELYAEAKRERNLLDFSDLEHFALEILEDKQTHEPRAVARTLSDQFEEIMIDEYQDSNYIQEEILSVISGENRGVHNRFMVGDVKQSIYGFRQAQPEIFVQKYACFSNEENEDSVAIDLQQNFRSRSEVLDGTNAVFDHLMGSDLGGIEYDAAARLNYGAKTLYGEDSDSSYRMKLVLADVDMGQVGQDYKEDEVSKEAEEAMYENKIEAEFAFVAREIKRVVGTKQVIDKEMQQKREARYSDIVILMRSPNAIADTIIGALEKQDIPARVESRQGYFDAIEVQVVLNLLRILDNPYQDIPFVSVLHSPIFGFTDDEIATLGVSEQAVYDTIATRAKAQDKKALRVVEFLETWRARVRELPIHVLLERILDVTGYLLYVSTLPRGEIRRANLEKLVDEAATYESTNYKDLFHFVRYIEHRQKYQVDQGEASLVSGGDDAVTLMSIHQSKGLEFPIVILAGACRKFNYQDANSTMVLHPTYGIGLDYIDVEHSAKYKTLAKAAVKHAITMQTVGEEMRVLYVAMTRAKEQLIITGMTKDATTKFVEWRNNVVSDILPLHQRKNASGYMEWIVRATAFEDNPYPVDIETLADLNAEEVIETVVNVDRRQALEQRIGAVTPEEVARVQEGFSFAYPYALDEHYKTKYSVSEIKHQSMEQMFAETDYDTPEFIEQEHETKVPLFISQKESETNRGALRGTAMHRFMECYDFVSFDSIANQLQRMITKGLLSSEQAELLSKEQLQVFLDTSEAKRMHAAAVRGDFYCEKPFVMEAYPADLFANATSLEPILVQGIIDAYWIEDGKIVLLDYKTDRVHIAQELVDRYQTQLALYANALSRAYDLPVSEILIYSFCLNTMIAL